MNRQRVAAIIIEDKKILLVRDGMADFFSMPGGSIEEGENHMEALARELDEEVKLVMVEARPYHSFDLINQTYNVPQTDHTYIATYTGTPTCSSEVDEMKWVTKDEMLSKEVKVPPAFFEKLLPKLIEDGLL